MNGISPHIPSAGIWNSAVRQIQQIQSESDLIPNVAAICVTG